MLWFSLRFHLIHNFFNQHVHIKFDKKITWLMIKQNLISSKILVFIWMSLWHLVYEKLYIFLLALVSSDDSILQLKNYPTQTHLFPIMQCGCPIALKFDKCPAAVLSRDMSNLRSIRLFWCPISWLWDFTRSYDETSYAILKWPLGS